MKALCWHGRGDIRCETVPDPKIENDRDAIIKVTSCAICGSDLHLYGGFVSGMKSGDVLGHETMGEVVAVGPGAAHKLKVGDRVVVPFTISCGECRQCKWGNYSLCEKSNPNGAQQVPQIGYQTAGLFGYSHMYGGFSGGQAEYLRVPYADVGPIKVPEGLTDEQVLFSQTSSPPATWLPRTPTSNPDRLSALTRKLEKLRGVSGFTGNAPGDASRWSTERSADWQPLRPTLVAEVAFDHVTAGRFRHGTRFLRWRPDKSPRQCSCQQIR